MLSALKLPVTFRKISAQKREPLSAHARVRRKETYGALCAAVFSIVRIFSSKERTARNRSESFLLCATYLAVVIAARNYDVGV